MNPDLPVLKPYGVVRILGPGIIDSQRAQSPKILALKQDRLLLYGWKTEAGRVKDSLSPERPGIERSFPETSIDKSLVDRLDGFGNSQDRGEGAALLPSQGKGFQFGYEGGLFGVSLEGSGQIGRAHV